MTRGRLPPSRRKKKIPIPKAIREQVWIETFGETFKHKCYIKWCKNEINVFLKNRNT